MCGRFTLHTPLELILPRFDLLQLDFEYYPSYNIAPTQPVLAVISDQWGRKASLMRWGLIPTWRKGGAPLINARLETLERKQTFRGLVNSSRCLIIADGFYEWKTEDSKKQPIYITLKQKKPFAFAGLWQNSNKPACTIVTQESTQCLKEIHQRMPVILSPRTEKLWLGPKAFEQIRGELEKDSPPLDFHPVSTLVNSPKNNSPACILPQSQSLFQ